MSAAGSPALAVEEEFTFTVNEDGESVCVTGYTGAYDVTEIIIPDTLAGKPVTSIGDYAFAKTVCSPHVLLFPANCCVNRRERVHGVYVAYVDYTS